MMSGMVERMPSENASLATDGLISYTRNGKCCTVAFGLQDVHEFLPCLHAGDQVWLRSGSDAQRSACLLLRNCSCGAKSDQTARRTAQAHCTEV